MEAGAGTPSASGGVEAGIMFTGNIKDTFAGQYINHGGTIGILGIDLTNTSINSNTNKSTTGITINGSLGTPLPEGHIRVGQTNVRIDNREEILDLTPIINFFK